MGFIDRFFNSGTSKEVSSDDVIKIMLANAAEFYGQGKFERAFDTYEKIVELTSNADAQYNLGSLYAQGKGTRQDFLQAAYWFHQAALSGDDGAEKLCTKSTMDYLHQGMSEQTPYQLFQKTVKYVSLLYPGKSEMEICGDKLYGLGAYHFNKQEYEEAAKLFRSAAEFCNHGMSQNYLAVLYNAGAGVKKDDIAALYWFDRGADNGVSASKNDRDGILGAYYQNFSAEEFYGVMGTLIDACLNGADEIPQDARKAAYWRNQRDELLRK